MVTAESRQAIDRQPSAAAARVHPCRGYALGVAVASCILAASLARAGESSNRPAQTVGQVPLRAIGPDSRQAPRERPQRAGHRGASAQATPRRSMSPVVRGQSPGEAWAGEGGYDDSQAYYQQGSRPAQSFGSITAGQVPIQPTDPYSSPSYPRRDAAGRGAVVSVQYTSPTAPPNYIPPPRGGVYVPPSTRSVPEEERVFTAPGADVPFGDGGGYVGPELIPTPGELYPPDVPLFEPSIDLQAIAPETQTGRIMLGVGVNSNAGVVGNIVVDEQNFDWRRFPSSWEEVRNGQAFRGAGQQFRLEAVPGNQVSRYLISFREPYLGGTGINFGLTGSFFNRRYRDWDEERLGGRISLGYQFAQITPDLSGSASLRLENVEISNARFPTPPELARVIGDNGVYSAEFALMYDTRDSAFLPTEGGRLKLAFEQAFGDFDFGRATVEARRYFLMRERPDGSGRHVLTLGTDLGFTSSDTPIFENFFAGGYTTLRGFYFREASPRSMNVVVGGRFQWINSVEYMFPVTADDALRGVVFCDFGTVEREVELHSENFRVSPGVGIRVTIPAMGPAPIALDLAFPVAHADGDRIQTVSFFVGFSR
ncbi:MAG: BamA/TamA family outer membrane protein [Pirellulales bacterium]